MKKYTWYIVGGVVLLLIIMGVGSYNSLVGAEETVNEKWANVEAAYQARMDKLKNLVPTVKEAAKYEGGTVERVTNARVGGAPQELLDALNAAEAAKSDGSGESFQNFQKAQDRLQKAVEGYDIYVNAVHEAYPDLKAVQNFQGLQDEISGIENSIKTERVRYNEAVKVYNTSIRSFPKVIFAGMFGFDKRDGFKAQEGAENAPDISKEFE